MVEVKELPGANAPSSFAAVISRFQAGQASTSVCRFHTVSSGAAMSIWWRAITGASRSMPVGAVTSAPVRGCGGLLAGVLGEYVDAAVAFGHVDHAAAVDQDVLGLVDELGGESARGAGWGRRG